MATGLELIKAAEAGDEARLRELLAGGADPDAGGGPTDTARRRRTALMAACEGAHAGCVRALLEAGASLKFVGPDGRDALSWAIEGGRAGQKEPERAWEARDSAEALACLELMLEAGGAKLINKEMGKGNDKATPLARAVSWLDMGCVRALLERGADPCQESLVYVRWQTNAALCLGRQWNSPLASAVSRGAAEACRALFEAGADPTAKPQWSPGIEQIVERCVGVSEETKAFLKEAWVIHAARLEAKALGAAAGPARAAARAPRV